MTEARRARTCVPWQRRGRGAAAAAAAALGLAALAPIGAPADPFEPARDAVESYARAIDHCRGAARRGPGELDRDHSRAEAGPSHAGVPHRGYGGFGHGVVAVVRDPDGRHARCVVDAGQPLGADERREVEAWAVLHYAEQERLYGATGFARIGERPARAMAWFCPEDGGPLTLTVEPGPDCDPRMTAIRGLPRGADCAGRG